jgi:hypothetical protein
MIARLLSLAFLLCSGCVAPYSGHAGTDECSIAMVRDVHWATERGSDVQRVIVALINKSGNYTHVVQEVVYDDGTLVLVEAFRISKHGEKWDYHRWGSRPMNRTMKVYCANVVGGDETPGGFCHLIRNLDGSRVTNAGPGFNASYQEGYKTTGLVESASEKYFTWSIRDDGKRVKVKLP